jgi:intracellular septation protein A
MTQPSWGIALSVRRSRLLFPHTLLALLVLASGVRLGFFNAARPDYDLEASPVARVFALSRLESFPGNETSGRSPFGEAQLAGYTFLTRAFDRQEPIAGVREAVVVAGILSTALLWVLLRRLEMPRWAAATAVVVLAVSPLAIGLHRLVVIENLAVPWILAALVVICSPHREPPLAHDLLAALYLLFAVLTSPLALAFVPAAAWLMLRRREGKRVVLTALVFEAGLGLAFGPAAGLLRPGLPDTAQPGIGGWLTLDPALVAIGAFAVAVSVFVHRLRPWALSVALLALALLWQGTPRPGVLAMLLPIIALLVAGSLSAVPDTRPRPSHRRSTRRRRLRPLFAIAILVAGTMASWVSGFVKLEAGERTPSALAQARKWLLDNASGSRVLTDDAGWAELAAAGWPTGSLDLVSNCETSCPAAEWMVTVSPRSAMLLARPVAIFDEVQIARLTAGELPAPQGEQLSRSRVGTVLADSSRVIAEGDTAGLLRWGRVDPRLLTTLAALAMIGQIQVGALPEVPGEDAADQPRRQAVITGDPDRSTRFFLTQRGVLRPLSVMPVPGGVLVTYPPLPPNGLLDSP